MPILSSICNAHASPRTIPSKRIDDPTMVNGTLANGNPPRSDDARKQLTSTFPRYSDLHADWPLIPARPHQTDDSALLLSFAAPGPHPSYLSLRVYLPFVVTMARWNSGRGSEFHKCPAALPLTEEEYACGWAHRTSAAEGGDCPVCGGEARSTSGTNSTEQNVDTNGRYTSRRICLPDTSCLFVPLLHGPNDTEGWETAVAQADVTVTSRSRRHTPRQRHGKMDDEDDTHGWWSDERERVMRQGRRLGPFVQLEYHVPSAMAPPSLHLHAGAGKSSGVKVGRAMPTTRWPQPRGSGGSLAGNAARWWEENHQTNADTSFNITEGVCRNGSTPPPASFSRCYTVCEHFHPAVVFTPGLPPSFVRSEEEKRNKNKNNKEEKETTEEEELDGTFEWWSAAVTPAALEKRILSLGGRLHWTEAERPSEEATRVECMMGHRHDPSDRVLNNGAGGTMASWGGDSRSLEESAEAKEGGHGAVFSVSLAPAEITPTHHHHHYDHHPLLDSTPKSPEEAAAGGMGNGHGHASLSSSVYPVGMRMGKRGRSAMGNRLTGEDGDCNDDGTSSLQSPPHHRLYHTPVRALDGDAGAAFSAGTPLSPPASAWTNPNAKTILPYLVGASAVPHVQFSLHTFLRHAHFQLPSEVACSLLHSLEIALRERIAKAVRSEGAAGRPRQHSRAGGSTAELWGNSYHTLISEKGKSKRQAEYEDNDDNDDEESEEDDSSEYRHAVPPFWVAAFAHQHAVYSSLRTTLQSDSTLWHQAVETERVRQERQEVGREGGATKGAWQNVSRSADALRRERHHHSAFTSSCATTTMGGIRCETLARPSPSSSGWWEACVTWPDWVPPVEDAWRILSSLQHTALVLVADVIKADAENRLGVAAEMRNREDDRTAATGAGDLPARQYSMLHAFLDYTSSFFHRAEEEKLMETFLKGCGGAAKHGGGGWRSSPSSPASTSTFTFTKPAAGGGDKEPCGQRCRPAAAAFSPMKSDENPSHSPLTRVHLSHLKRYHASFSESSALFYATLREESLEVEHKLTKRLTSQGVPSEGGNEEEGGEGEGGVTTEGRESRDTDRAGALPHTGPPSHMKRRRSPQGAAPEASQDAGLQALRQRLTYLQLAKTRFEEVEHSVVYPFHRATEVATRGGVRHDIRGGGGGGAGDFRSHHSLTCRGEASFKNGTDKKNANQDRYDDGGEDGSAIHSDDTPMNRGRRDRRSCPHPDTGDRCGLNQQTPLERSPASTFAFPSLLEMIHYFALMWLQALSPEVYHRIEERYLSASNPHDTIDRAVNTEMRKSPFSAPTGLFEREEKASSSLSTRRAVEDRDEGDGRNDSIQNNAYTSSVFAMERCDDISGKANNTRKNPLQTCRSLFSDDGADGEEEDPFGHPQRHHNVSHHAASGLLFPPTTKPETSVSAVTTYGSWAWWNAVVFPWTIRVSQWRWWWNRRPNALSLGGSSGGIPSSVPPYYPPQQWGGGSEGYARPQQGRRQQQQHQPSSQRRAGETAESQRNRRWWSDMEEAEEDETTMIFVRQNRVASLWEEQVEEWVGSAPRTSTRSSASSKVSLPFLHGKARTRYTDCSASSPGHAMLLFDNPHLTSVSLPFSASITHTTTQLLLRFIMDGGTENDEKRGSSTTTSPPFPVSYSSSSSSYFSADLIQDFLFLLRWVPLVSRKLLWEHEMKNLWETCSTHILLSSSSSSDDSRQRRRGFRFVCAVMIWISCTQWQSPRDILPITTTWTTNTTTTTTQASHKECTSKAMEDEEKKAVTPLSLDHRLRWTPRPGVGMAAWKEFLWTFFAAHDWIPTDGTTTTTTTTTHPTALSSVVCSSTSAVSHPVCDSKPLPSAVSTQVAISPSLSMPQPPVHGCRAVPTPKSAMSTTPGESYGTESEINGFEEDVATKVQRANAATRAVAEAYFSCIWITLLQVKTTASKCKRRNEVPHSLSLTPHPHHEGRRIKRSDRTRRPRDCSLPSSPPHSRHRCYSPPHPHTMSESQGRQAKVALSSGRLRQRGVGLSLEEEEKEEENRLVRRRGFSRKKSKPTPSCLSLSSVASSTAASHFSLASTTSQRSAESVSKHLLSVLHPNLRFPHHGFIHNSKHDTVHPEGGDGAEVENHASISTLDAGNAPDNIAWQKSVHKHELRHLRTLLLSFIWDLQQRSDGATFVIVKPLSSDDTLQPAADLATSNDWLMSADSPNDALHVLERRLAQVFLTPTTTTTPTPTSIHTSSGGVGGVGEWCGPMDAVRLTSGSRHGPFDGGVFGGDAEIPAYVWTILDDSDDIINNNNNNNEEEEEEEEELEVMRAGSERRDGVHDTLLLLSPSLASSAVSVDRFPSNSSSSGESEDHEENGDNKNGHDGHVRDEGERRRGERNPKVCVRFQSCGQGESDTDKHNKKNDNDALREEEEEEHGWTTPQQVQHPPLDFLQMTSSSHTSSPPPSLPSSLSLREEGEPFSQY